MIDFRKLIEAGVHFGHKKSRWNPKMGPYIWGYRNNIHLIDVLKTAQQMQKAREFLRSVAADGKTILVIGTKKSAQEIVANVAKKLDEPYVNHRWIGGTLTNFSQVKKSVTKLLHFEDILEKSADSFYTKKELVSLEKHKDRLAKNVGSIRSLSWPIGALLVVDAKKEHTAIKEAIAAGIPVIAIVDTNTDPSSVTIPVPANDDAPKSIMVVLEYLAEGIAQGQQEAANKPKEEVAARELGSQKEGDELLAGEDGEDEDKQDAKRAVKKLKKEREAAAAKMRKAPIKSSKKS